MYYLKHTPVDDLRSSILTLSEISINFRPFSILKSNIHYKYIGYHDNTCT